MLYTYGNEREANVKKSYYVQPNEIPCPLTPCGEDYLQVCPLRSRCGIAIPTFARRFSVGANRILRYWLVCQEQV